MAVAGCLQSGEKVSSKRKVKEWPKALSARSRPRLRAGIAKVATGHHKAPVPEDREMPTCRESSRWVQRSPPSAALLERVALPYSYYSFTRRLRRPFLLSSCPRGLRPS